jgi:hypothetical protein
MLSAEPALFTVTPAACLSIESECALAVCRADVEEITARIEADSINQETKCLGRVAEYASHTILVGGLVETPAQDYQAEAIRSTSSSLTLNLFEAGSVTVLRHDSKLRDRSLKTIRDEIAGSAQRCRHCKRTPLNSFMSVEVKAPGEKFRRSHC